MLHLSMIPAYVHSQEGPWIPQAVSPTINGSSFNILWSTARGGVRNTCWPLQKKVKQEPSGPRFSATSHFPIQTQWQTCAQATFVERIREVLQSGRQGADGQNAVNSADFGGRPETTSYFGWVVKIHFLVGEIPYFLNKSIHGITNVSIV